MKFILIGKQGSNKHYILNKLEVLGHKVGREFSNLPEKLDNVYLDPKYEFYSTDEINKIFETKSYMYMSGFEELGIIDSHLYYKGLSHYTYDNSEIIAINPMYLEQFNKSLLSGNSEPIIFIWLDDNRTSRIRVHTSEQRTHFFVHQETIESNYDSDFVKSLYNFPNSDVLYFTGEVPDRVITIIDALIKHPDLIPSFIENFN